MKVQPPSGGCVLKRGEKAMRKIAYGQPPSRGCVLKRPNGYTTWCKREAAASARLCVETLRNEQVRSNCQAAAFGWLCVEMSFRPFG